MFRLTTDVEPMIYQHENSSDSHGCCHPDMKVTNIRLRSVRRRCTRRWRGGGVVLVVKRCVCTIEEGGGGGEK